MPFKVLMAGRNIDKKNKHLFAQIKKNNLENNVILLGNIDNIYEIENKQVDKISSEKNLSIIGLSIG